MNSQVSNLELLLARVRGATWTKSAIRTVSIDERLLQPVQEKVTRAELAQALNVMLFVDLIDRVPAARTYVDDVIAAGQKVNFDHGAVRTVKWLSGALPPGEESITRILRPLGFRVAGLYPLERLKMTGRSWCHEDFPEEIAQFFISELHPERFSQEFQNTVARVLSTSKDPLGAEATWLLEQLSTDGRLTHVSAEQLLPILFGCFSRHHELFDLESYELLKRESAEMAWISTEGNTFNHATDRVLDVEAVAQRQRMLGRPIKDCVEVSSSGRVRQTAFEAASVQRAFSKADGTQFTVHVPGSFYEFITRDKIESTSKLDLEFDASNATGIFAMTAGRPAGATTNGA